MSTNAPDVIGLELEEARRRLAAAGLAIAAVTESRSPLPGVQLSGGLRVVRQRLGEDGSVELVVTPERYDPATLRGGSPLP